MALLRASALRQRAREGVPFNKSIESVILEHMEHQRKSTTHDIFMSHAFDDKELVLGAALTIEDMGFTVYLDWRDDQGLDRGRITSATAETLRIRMKQSRSLFFATTEHTSQSKWMPWELGFMDGQNGKSAILPIDTTNSGSFKGQEYLSIYPYVSDGVPKGESENTLWIHDSPDVYVTWKRWIAGGKPVLHS